MKTLNICPVWQLLCNLFPAFALVSKDCIPQFLVLEDEWGEKVFMGDIDMEISKEKYVIKYLFLSPFALGFSNLTSSTRGISSSAHWVIIIFIGGAVHQFPLRNWKEMRNDNLNETTQIN